MHGFLRRARVHVFEPVHQGVGLVFGHKVGLADENLVGKTHLAPRFLAVIELGGGVFRVHQRQNRIEQVTFGDFVVHEKGLRHRARVSQAGGLDHHAVKIELSLAPFFSQVAQRPAQVFSDGAADAAIAHLNDLFFGFRDQNVAVDVFLAEFVFNDGNFLPVGFLQYALQQRGFAGTEKTGQDGGGDQTHDFCLEKRSIWGLSAQMG